MRIDYMIAEVVTQHNGVKPDIVYISNAAFAALQDDMVEPNICPIVRAGVHIYPEYLRKIVEATHNDLLAYTIQY